MARKSREEMAGGLYHVWARGAKQAPIFHDDEDRQTYLRIWRQVARDRGWRCLAYCLMDNHVHHLIELTEPNLGAGMKDAHNAYARWLNARHEGSGHVIESRFGSSRAKSEGVGRYFACYVLLNPVKAHMCPAPADYAWSSAADSLDVKPAASSTWLDLARLWSYFARDDATDGAARLNQMLDAVQLLGAFGFAPETERL